MIDAVLDINVIVSAVIIARGIPFELWLAWQAERFSLLTSRGIVAELEGKLREPKIAQRYGLSTDDIAAVVGLLMTQARFVTVPPDQVLAVTGDPEDDLVLATGRLGRAAYLVTGDRGLLGLGQYEGMAVVTPRAFFDILGAMSENVEPRAEGV